MIKAAVHGILRNLTYYQNRGKDIKQQIEEIERQAAALESASEPAGLMGVEGRIRQQYYAAFAIIVGDDFPLRKRVRQPPDNPLNAMISFGNSLCYAACLSEIYRTQLNPLIS